jgi:hypothetical protein
MWSSAIAPCTGRSRLRRENYGHKLTIFVGLTGILTNQIV